MVAHLIASAPARTMARTTARTWSMPLATLSGSVGSGGTQQSWPDGLTRSPIPPVGEMIFTPSDRRGPFTSPSSMASLKPASSPPASRTVV